MKKIWTATGFHTYPSGVANVTLVSHDGKEISARLRDDVIDVMRQTFLMEPVAGSLSHAHWHATNPDAHFPCSICKNKDGIQ